MQDIFAFTDNAKLLTGPDRGAVAVIRIQCQHMSAQHLADPLFRSVGGRSLSKCQVGRITYGDWRGEDVVVVRTKPTEWEVSCHGGAIPIERILSDLAASGISTTESRANQVRPDESSFESWSNLLKNTRTIRTADLILGQPAAIHALATELGQMENHEDVRCRIKRFLKWQVLVDHFTKPWIVAIAGQPNAGKSSLLNAIVGYQRSIVFDQPGTTRDAVQCDVVISGWPIRFVDTAGIRNNTDDDIEVQGINAARNAIMEADLCLVVIDRSQGLLEPDLDLVRQAKQSGQVALICNKSDLPRTTSCEEIEAHSKTKTFEVSAKQALGLSEVLDWVAANLVPEPPTHGEALPISPRMKKICKQFLADDDRPRLLKALESEIKTFNISETAVPPR